MQEIKKALKPKKEYANDKAYGTAFTAMAKELGYWQPRPKRTKRKDTHDYKADKAKENELNAKALAKQKDLKEQIAQLRTELQTQKAARSDYAALEQLNKDLKEKIKQKDLLLEDLATETKKFKDENQTLQRLAYTTKNSVNEKYSYLEDKVDKQESQVIRLEEQLRVKDFEITWRDTELEERKKENTTLKSQNEALNTKISTLPRLDVIEELETLKNDFEELNEGYWELFHLAYDDNNIETVFDEYGVTHDKIFEYKEGYEKAMVEIAKKDELIKVLNDGYEKIEKNIFGTRNQRTTDEVVEGVSSVANILFNISKYLNLGMTTLVALFKDKVPTKDEVTQDIPDNIKSTLSDSNKKQSKKPKRRSP